MPNLDEDYLLTLQFRSVTATVGPLLCCALFLHLSLPAASLDKSDVATNGPDAFVREFRFDDLEATVRTMQAGAKRDYFAGVIANRTGHLEDSIRLLNDALPALRKSELRELRSHWRP